MLDAIIAGIVSAIVGYIIPQPKWAKMLQAIIWDWIKRKFKNITTRK